jgi:outer membrane protein assembly factor BamB
MVYCLNGDSGTVEWDTTTGYGNCIDSPPAIDDVDNDGKPEIVLGTFNGHVFCFNGEDGSVEWHINVGATSAIQSGPNLLDLDRDGDLDVFISQWAGDYRVYALDGEDGSTIWYSDVPTDHMYHSGSFADIDGDAHPEIAIGCYDSHVYCFNDDSSLAWDHGGSWYVGAPTCMADLDNDGDYEIIYVSWYVVGALHHTGSSHLWTFNASSGSFRGCAIADIDENDTLDVALGCDDGYLQVVRGNSGQLLWEIDLSSHYGQEYDIDHAPVIADFDGDGKLDIFVVGGHAESSQPQNNHGRAYALRAGDGTGPGWPMFRHDLRHSACFDGPLGIGEKEGPKDYRADRLYIRCCPNPFTSSTEIVYQVARSGQVSIAIYDISGSLVKTVLDVEREQGRYRIRWDGTDGKGGGVVPGIYFCRMEAGGITKTAKLTIID